jgi:hypothetical protein
MHKSSVVLAFIIPVIVVCLLRLLGGFDGVYGQDPYEYLRYAQALRHFFLTGIPPGDYFWPVGYPLAGALLSLIIPNTALSLQLISALSLGLIYFYSLKIVSLIYPSTHKTHLVFSGVFMVVSPYMLRFGLSVMSEVFTLGTLVAGTYFILAFVKKQGIHTLWIGVFLFSVSVMSRYAAAILILPMGIYGLIAFFRQQQKWYFFLVAGVAALIPLVPHLLIRADNPGGFIFQDLLTLWSPQHFFQRNFSTPDGITHYSLPNLGYSLAGLFFPRYFALGIVIVLLGFRKLIFPGPSRVIGLGVLLYLIFLAGIPFQNNRFLLLAFPFFIILLYPAIQYCFGLVEKRMQWGLFVLVVMGQILLFTVSFKKVWSRAQLEREIYAYLSQHPSAIYTLDMDISLKGRGYTAPLHNMLENYYDKVDTNALVLFNPAIFTQQWKGKNPVLNWEHFNKDHHLTEIKTFKQGWKAYVFK